MAAATPPSGKKSIMKSPWTWVGIAAIALIGGAYLLYRRNQASQAAASTSTTAAPSQDQQDYSGQISTLQSEIANLQGTVASNDVVKVPDLKGMSVAAATAALTSVGLKAGAHAGDTGTVNGQTPAAGTSVEAGSTVDLSVAGSSTTTGGGGGTTGTTTDLKAPAKASVTPRQGGADIGGGSVDGAKAYEILVQGAGGKGTGTSHYDHVLATNHADVTLTPGNYVTRSRAGTSAANVHGPWSEDTAFTVPKASGPGQTHPGGKGTPPPKTKQGGK